MVTSAEPDPQVTAICDRCGESFSAGELKFASAPPVRSVAVNGVCEPDDLSTLNPESCLDQKRYCESCVRTINFRRRLMILTVCVAMPILGLIIRHFLL